MQTQNYTFKFRAGRYDIRQYSSADFEIFDTIKKVAVASEPTFAKAKSTAIDWHIRSNRGA